LNKGIKTWTTAALVAALGLIVTACGGGGGGGGGEQGGGGETITVGSKNFTEQYVLAELYAQALSANGFNGETRIDLGSEQIADQALQSGEIDMYPEYTGTALVSILDVEPPLPDTAEETYEQARKLYADRDPENAMLEPADFNNNYAIIVRKETAEEYGLKTLDDLAKASPELTFASYSEFENRSDGFPNVKENYPGMNFKDKVIVNDLGLRYRALAEGEADVGIGFRTDGQLTSDELVEVEDTKNIWPVYQPAPVFRSEVLEQNPEAREVVNTVTRSLTVDKMREMNGAVDLQREEPNDVARQYLEEEGLLEQQ
jgi:osmoprotectant transport system substrate-binding protein